MGKKKQKKIWHLVVALIVVVVGGMLFVGAAAGWFSEKKARLSEEYYKDNVGIMDFDAAEYDSLASEGKSFLVLVDQEECNTADQLREFTENLAVEKNVAIYRIMFEEMKKSSLGEYVKYYPSFVVVSKGKVLAFLRADSDEDADEYNNYEDFSNWVSRYVVGL